MKVKAGVNFAGLGREIADAAWVVESVLIEHELEAVITSGRDGVHKAGSKHYVGSALDFRSKHVPRHLLNLVTEQLRSRLGRHFDVLLEHRELPNEHLHVEYDPKE